jgi:D-alanyl-D-alanine carboxypeptidase
MKFSLKTSLYPITTLILVATCVVAGYFYYQKSLELDTTKVELLNTKTDLDQLVEQNMILQTELEAEKYKNSIFSGQISEIAGTVGTLNKLAKTDRELLQKYSKVYFLNEHYVPDDLVEIPPDYIYEGGKKIQFHAKAYPYLQKLLVDTKDAGFEIKIISAYRSFGEQGVLKNGYMVNYGSGANRFSADQGYSEHQLGTALDFTTRALGAGFTSFAKTEAYSWLQANAYKYGFVISYPEDNTYYQFEPWHWRFVGVSLATMLHEEGQNFYDVLQSKIDAYLIKIFD